MQLRPRPPSQREDRYGRHPFNTGSGANAQHQPSAADVGLGSQAAVWMRVGRVRFAPNRDQVSQVTNTFPGHKRTKCSAANLLLFDHLVGARNDCSGNGEPKCLSGREIDNEFELGGLLDRNIGRLLPAENLIGKVGRAPPQV